ncbi:DUF3558 domain-containing protein [Saccharothrix australiensis]|uniref:DUF3558 domain-containing protein n=1 Tax=Saccharothrix australiensis TaxID=2072 RepID=UPI001476DD38|nr:DUF3558 domain-containing protein [Saccharothrix australiensis]
MNRTIRAALVVSSAVAVLAACTTTDPGDPTAGPTTGTSERTPTTSGSATGGASGLSLAKYLSNPCAILTKAQQAELTTFREAKATEGTFGPACTYQGKDVLENSTFEISLVVKGNTIDDFIEEAKAGMSVAEETKVDGRPAINFDSADGKRNCSTAVGTSDKEAVLVQANIGKNDKLNDDKACEKSERVAKTVIGNLRG